MRASITRRFVVAITGVALALSVVGIQTAPAHATPPPGATTDYVIAGSFQSELGCPGDWQAACLETALIRSGSSSIWTTTLPIPAGNWEFKVGVGGSLTGSYGLDGGAANIPLSVAGDADITFIFDATTHQIGYQVDGLREGYEIADGDLTKTPAVDPGAGNQYYFVLTDRFANGESANDKQYYAVNGDESSLTTSDDKYISGYDPADTRFYQGGDIQGIISKLDYIEGLGTTAIWLSPSFVNRPVQGDNPSNSTAGYHGYWITDFTRIDPHLGGNEALADLIEQAHDRGMKVYFDIIANHTADVIAYQGVSGEASYVTTTTVPYTDSSGDVFNPADYASGDLGPFPTLDPATSFPYVPFHPEGAPSLVPSELNDVTLYHNRGNILGDQWQDAGEWTTMGDFSSLDDLMTENPAVVSLMIDIYTSWMDMGIDGFRIDTVKHVNFEFWQQFTAAIKAYQSSGAAGVQPNFFTFGEIYDQDIAGQTSPYMRDTDMNAVLDFPFAFGARTWAKSGDGTGQDLANMFAADDYYITSDSDPNDLVTFLDNHDMGRIGWLLQSAGASDVGARVKLANDLMFLSRGQPVIYYGDEQGILGIGADSLSREGLYANQSTAYQNSPLLDGGTLGTAEHYDTTGAYYEQIQTLSALRVDHPALATGAHVNLGAQWSAYAFARIGDDQVENLIGVNSGTAFAPLTFTTLTPGATYTAYYASGTDGVRSGQTVTADANGLVTLDIPALGAVALEADRIVSDPAIPVTDATFTVTPGIDLGGAGTNTKVSGLAPITANAPKSAWSQTTFSVRVVGSDTWTILGTDTGPNPRVFDNTSKYAAGTLLEYRAVNMDAAGTLVASSTLAGVGVTAEPPADNSASVGWVTIAGALGATGCADWDPACAGLKLEVDPASGLYTTTLSLSAGVYEYKVALNGTWTENYGNYANGVTGMFNGANHQFTLGSATSVFFWYNSETHAFGEVLDGVPHDTIYTVTGTFIESLLMPQDLATCSNWSDVCLRGLMTQDPTVPTRYVWETSAIEAGTDYTAKVVTNMSWSNTSYGPQGTDPGCAPDGWYDSSNCKFTVPAGATVRFVLDTTNNYVSITVLPVVDKGIDALRAYWIDQQTIAWPNALASDATSWTLVTAPEGGITANGSIITTTVGGTSVSQITLTRDPLGLTPSQVDKFRLLASGYTVLKVPAASIGDIPDLLKGETVIAAFAPGKTLRSLTGTQNAGVLDDVYASAARAAIAGGEALGVSWTGDTPTLRLWAPTALDVDLCLYADAEGTGTCVEQTTTLDDATGTWTALGQSDWKDRAYDWNVEVYALEFEYQPNGSVSAAEQLSPTYDSVYNNVVVDPYATGLTVDSTHAVVVKPSDYTPSETQPDTIRSVDQTIYELHVRDFSMADTDADVVIKGTYEAFTDLTSPGMIQLAELQAAGMTTIHLLPTFDIASIPEDRADQLHGDVPADTNGYAARDAVCGPDGITGISAGDGGGTEGCNGYKPNGDKTVASLDGYNWGYDPLHWMAPEGSYAASGTVPDATYSQVGAARNQQFADMVDALHSIGLRVVLDQVYNHTFSSGQTYDNVLDQAVPGYYHRLNQAGAVEKSTCCDEFAGENQMAEQMMIDSVLTWARDYKIDGFRFDLMGFTPYSSMVKLQEALAALADEQGRSGVGDDPAYYLYGEGWDFGSIANNRLFYTAIQGQVNGTGIGTFSDRLRDASLGSHAPLTATGFVTGSPGACNNADVAQGLAGNLYAYTGANVAGCYGHSVGYAENPSETVTYVDAHDNQTLYDMLAMRLPAGTSMADRIRYNTLALATVTFAQTPTFWHGGTDLLRSKSLDPNSYNSGDHFNLIDWTGATNAYGTGLPPTTNRDHADYAGIMSSLLGNASIKPTQADAETAHAMALDLLRLRSSSELFRLGTTDLIKERVTFLPTDNPGVLAMLVSDPSSGSVDIDGLHDAMLVVFNTNTWSVSQGLSGLSGRDFALSDIQSGGADDVVKGTTWTSASGIVSVPALSVAVLFEAASAPEFTPTISGTPKVGELLTATSNVPDGWTVGSENGYQWFRDGVEISGGSAATYTTVADDLNATITVMVHATRDGYPDAVGLSDGMPIGQGEITIASVAVSGTAVVDSVVSAAVGTVTPSGTTPTYQWYRDGGEIDDATGVTYTLVAADANTEISVKVTESKDGYATEQLTSAPVSVANGSAVSFMPSVSGVTKVGETLTATPNVPEGWTLAGYQWSRGPSPISGATSSTYTLTADDLYQMITVKVTATKDGYDNATGTSLPKTPTQGVITIESVAITGTAQVDLQVSASVGTVTPSDADLTYQWYRDGVPIDDATSIDYTLVAADSGQPITVKVTAAKTAYETEHKTSDPVTVEAGTITITSVVVSGTVEIGQSLSALVSGVSVPGATLSYQWLRAGQPIANATESTYTLTTKDVCSQISVRVTVSKTGYTSPSPTSESVQGPVFSDVPSSHTFYSPICWVAQAGVTAGTGAGTYSPSDPVDRGSMAVFLYRMAGSPTWTPPATSPFVDVPTTHEYYSEITWLAASGITVGVVIDGATYYQPDNAVNRGSMSAFLYRLSGSPSYTAPAKAKFADVPKTHTFYKTISWLASKNITAGTTVGEQLLYQPSNPVNRGSMAAFLSRLANQHLQCTKYPNGVGCTTG